MTSDEHRKTGEAIVQELDRLRERNRRFNKAAAALSFCIVALALWLIFALVI
jgi:hypothetical protein